MLEKGISVCRIQKQRYGEEVQLQAMLEEVYLSAAQSLKHMESKKLRQCFQVTWNIHKPRARKQTAVIT